jgi:protoheme ferro-lyase
MFNLFRKNTEKSKGVKMTSIKRFDSEEEYLNMLNEIISDTKVDSNKAAPIAYGLKQPLRGSKLEQLGIK